MRTAMSSAGLYRFAVCLSLVAVALPGCRKAAAPVPPKFTQADLPSDEELRDMIDEVLDFTYTERQLDTQTHAAWQILHGVLAYGKTFPVEHNGEIVESLPWVLSGGRMKGWTMRKGEVGLRAILEPGSAAGQGHEDQWLAVISQCDLPSDTPIILGDETYTIGDLVNQAMFDIYQDKEASWTLIGLSRYLPLDAKWKSRDGEEWTIERIIAMEASQDINTSACGGTHRLIGMEMALDRYRSENPDAELTGGWKDAQERIDWAIQTARAHQQPSGAFSVNYFARPSDSPDDAAHLGSTGHTLEFLSLAMEADQLSEPWVVKGAVHLCDVFRRTRDLPMECGALYHAAHGLQLYREKRFGPRPMPGSSVPSESSPTSAPPKTASR